MFCLLCKTSSPELEEELKLWMFQNKVLREKFELEMEELREN